MAMMRGIICPSRASTTSISPLRKRRSRWSSAPSTFPSASRAYTHFFATRTLRLGNPEDLSRSLELWSIRNLFERLPRMINAVLLVFLSIFLFVLYFTQKGHVEYLWLAFHELIQAPIGFIDLAGSSANLDQLWYVALIFQLVLISAYLYFEFLNCLPVAAAALVHPVAALQLAHHGRRWRHPSSWWDTKASSECCWSCFVLGSVIWLGGMVSVLPHHPD